jgi:pilus assembly protein CpaC
LQNTSSNAVEQLPWLGDVPVLGALFSSRSYQKNETDLAIIVTPRLVRPARPGDVVRTPLDKTLPANDIDFFLMGKSEIRREALRLATRATHPAIGHMLDMQKHSVEVISVKGGEVVSAKN